MSFDFLFTLLQFILALGLLMFFHEAGHFLMARLFHIEVEEFGLGLPPRIVRLFTWQGTEFTLNWIPFGAFVRPKGENDPSVPGGLASESPWKRLGVLLGGPTSNILVGILVFTIMFMRIGAPVSSVVQIVQVNEGTPAQLAGLQVGDTVLSMNEQPVENITSLQDFIQANLGKEVILNVERAGTKLDLAVTPRTDPPEGQGPLGISLGNPYTPVSITQAFPTAIQATWQQAESFIMLPVRLIQGQISTSETRFVGPKGMFDIYQEARQRDVEATSSPVDQPAVNVLLILGTISIALGLTNLLPIPALDGGRILFVIPEILLRRRVPPQYENLVHLVGFAALLLLMGYITIQDFANPIIQP